MLQTISSQCLNLLQMTTWSLNLETSRTHSIMEVSLSGPRRMNLSSSLIQDLHGFGFPQMSAWIVIQTICGVQAAVKPLKDRIAVLNSCCTKLVLCQGMLLLTRFVSEMIKFVWTICHLLKLLEPRTWVHWQSMVFLAYLPDQWMYRPILQWTRTPLSIHFIWMVRLMSVCFLFTSLMKQTSETCPRSR